MPFSKVDTGNKFRYHANPHFCHRLYFCDKIIHMHWLETGEPYLLFLDSLRFICQPKFAGKTYIIFESRLGLLNLRSPEPARAHELVGISGHVGCAAA